MKPDWDGPDNSLGRFIRAESKATLQAYHNQPNLITEHANTEDAFARGGYADRQLLELVQNSTDALASAGGGRIRIKLTPSYLYCADNGVPINQDGVRALMFSRISPKRGTTQIGRYGLGFKSVLNVTDRPVFFSRSGSFKFDREQARRDIRSQVPEARSCPTLRLAYPIDPIEAFRKDHTLKVHSAWANNIVRLPLKRGAYQRIAEQIREFPSEFLLFAEHIRVLTVDVDGWEPGITFQCRKQEDRYVLTEDEAESVWKVFRRAHTPSGEARADRRTTERDEQVVITWAVPLDRLNKPGAFWKFFPTMTPSLAAGILNAQWKTNEDRQNLLPGAFNEDLINVAAGLIAESLPRLMTKDDPAKHLDTLPRRKEPGDNKLTDFLRERLFSELANQRIVPDQDGVLQRIMDLRYPPSDLPPNSDAVRRWVAQPTPPSSWAHPQVTTPHRMAAITRLKRFEVRSPYTQVPRTTIAEWLEALVAGCTSVDERIKASMAAIQIAALIPTEIRHSQSLGRIALTANGSWALLEAETIYLSGIRHFTGDPFVHPSLESDSTTLKALNDLGITYPTPETRFRNIVDKLFRKVTPFESDWRPFWALSREADHLHVQQVVQTYSRWNELLRVRTVDGDWQRFSNSLLPGPIVPKDGSRDGNIAIDTSFHKQDLSLLRVLGATDRPSGHFAFKQHDPMGYDNYRQDCIVTYKRLISRKPQDRLLTFDPDTIETTGPLRVFSNLSELGKVRYSEHLLSLTNTFAKWRMFHSTQKQYPPHKFPSPTIDMLRRHGRVQVYSHIARLSDGLGTNPKSREVRSWLLAHINSKLIREAFHIEIDEQIEPDGRDETLLLCDEWPGLKEALSPDHMDHELVRCDRLVSDDRDVGLKCFRRDNMLYLVRRDEEEKELRAVLGELGQQLTDTEIEKILLRKTPSDIEAARSAVRLKRTDATRLLAAVRQENLERGLPEALRAVLNDGPADGLRIAEAAIATYDVGALREYRRHLTHLDPPKQWAGRRPAVDFVISLGFGPEWAGQRSRSRPPFEEVDGPYSLPPLHPYQRKIVRNLIGMLGSYYGVKRGLISLPTGSGKTRVAVQGIVEAIREETYAGGVLWIADRDELCEQAVESWRQVWSNKGMEATPLRISRLWKGQRNPVLFGGQHVIVASIQTLGRRVVTLNRNPTFLQDFRLAVFDEAHRSIAPSFTKVMQQLGLTYRRRADEPYLLGLTATPYRGHNEEETERLVKRYAGNRLDSGVFASDDAKVVTGQLQDMRILAKADHIIIEGGQFSLRDDELREMREKRLPWLPRRLESDMGHDRNRTRRIIDSYIRHIRRAGWPTLIFATSVDHSKTLAALLSMAGVRARAVDSATHPSIRRKVVDDFRSGYIEVLVNYGVFREGFDAPKTRAIIVARPVYSPNLYFQMIGRGLRGPKNGGNERCLILNVRDNIVNYGENLAFTELDWLWAKRDR